MAHSEQVSNRVGVYANMLNDRISCIKTCPKRSAHMFFPRVICQKIKVVENIKTITWLIDRVPSRSKLSPLFAKYSPEPAVKAVWRQVPHLPKMEISAVSEILAGGGIPVAPLLHPEPRRWNKVVDNVGTM